MNGSNAAVIAVDDIERRADAGGSTGHRSTNYTKGSGSKNSEKSAGFNMTFCGTTVPRLCCPKQTPQEFRPAGHHRYRSHSPREIPTPTHGGNTNHSVRKYKYRLTSITVYPVKKIILFQDRAVLISFPSGQMSKTGPRCKKVSPRAKYVRTRINRTHRGVASAVSIDAYGGATCSRGRPSTPPSPSPALGGGDASLAEGDFLKHSDTH